MFTTSIHTHHSGRAAASIAAALVVLGLGAAPSSAQQDPGPPVADGGYRSGCSLQRVGTQFVRCDDLTGNGVSAPGYIPQR
jgi:hypothetical protein